MPALPKFTIRQLIDSGVHFGHKTMRWNPRMAPYIYGSRNGIHIINLQETVPLLHKSMEIARDVAKNNGRILFVSTKRQASTIVAEAAKRCGQYYVNHRWLGGTLTNWNTISKSIKTLRTLESQLSDEELVLSKKERLQLKRKLDKLERALGGIKDMGGIPDLIFVIDTNKEKISILEANTLGIPVIAIADTNTNPDNITHIIPGNDDSAHSIQLYCNLIADSILSGIQDVLGKITPEKERKKAVPAKAAPAKAAQAKATPAKAAAKKEDKPKAKKVSAKKSVKKEDQTEPSVKEVKAKKEPAKAASAKAAPAKAASAKKKTVAKKETAA